MLLLCGGRGNFFTGGYNLGFERYFIENYFLMLEDMWA